MISDIRTPAPSAEESIPSPNRGSLPRVLVIAGWFLILANFFWFSAKAVYSHFAPDEMMNMAWAWEAGLPRILRALLEFWSGFYRPTGALYYWTLHHLFGLNPVPFRVFDLAELALNLLLAYRVALLLSRSVFVAMLSTFVFSYHVSISIWTTYNGAFVYDRLCFTFYFAAFLLYLEDRQRNRFPGAIRSIVIVLLYVMALDAKEMAVTLPVMMLAYELIQDVKAIRNLGLTFLMAVMTLAFVIGKTHGSNAMVANPAYRPTDIGLVHFFHSQSEYMNELLFKPQAHLPLPPGLLVFAVMFALAAVFRDRCLAFAASLALIAPLPIAFLQRGGGCLYIVYLGWTLFAARLVYRLGWWLGDRFRLSVEYAWMPTGALAAIGLIALVKANIRHQGFAQPAMLSNGNVTWSAITEMNRLRPNIPSHSTVAYLHTPFKDWDMFFITELWRNDPSVHVVLTEKTPLSPAELAKAKVVLNFDSTGHLRQVAN